MADIKEQLQQAHTLIKEKKYQQARRLLVGIDHPMAVEWRAKIDTLLAQEADKARVKTMQATSSSPAVTPDRTPRRAQKEAARPASPGKTDVRATALTPEQTKAQLIKAGELMKRQAYDEARAILEKLDHPKATEWLDRLDNIAPKDAPVTSSLSTSAAEQRAKFKRDALSMDTPLPENPPSAPFSLMPRNMRGAPLASFSLAGNWANLGKPTWGTLTTITAISILAGLGLAMAFYAATFTAPVIPVGVMFGLMLTLIVAAYSFPYMIAWMQDGAYKRWQQGDIRGMIEHDYQIMPRMGGWLGIHAVVLVILIVVGFVQYTPQTFTNDDLTLTYPAFWSPVDLPSTSFCQELNVNQSCLLYLTRGETVEIALMNDRDIAGYGLGTLDGAVWQSLTEHGYQMDGNAKSLMIDNHQGVIRRFYLPNHEGYAFEIVVLHENSQKLLIIMGAAQSSAIMNKYWNEIESIINELDFHDNGRAT